MVAIGEVQAICWGEILWDLYPDGPVLGGAPANVAYHVAALGGPVALASAVGDDDRGREAIRRLGAHGVDTGAIQVDTERPTGAVTVTIANGEATYSLNRGGAWEYIALTDSIRTLLSTAGAICFGTLSQRTPEGRAALMSALAVAPSDCLRVCDPNLRPKLVQPDVIRASLEAADVVKINDREAAQIEQLYGVSDAIAWLFEELGVRVVALTRGARGSRLMTTGSHHDHPGFPATGGDTVGAGDAYTATLVHMLLRKQPIDRINDAANRCGAFVASQHGATPTIPAELIEHVNG